MNKPVSTFQRVVCAALASVLMLQPAAAATYQLNINVPGLGAEDAAPGTGIGDVDTGADPVRAKLTLTPGLLRFNAREGDGPISRRAVLKNTGTAPAVLSGIASTSQFEVNSSCVSPLQPGVSCVLTTTFTPKDLGDLSDSIVISAAGAVAPVELTWMASVVVPSGPYPWLSTSEDMVNLGAVEPGAPASDSVTVQNVGTAAAQLSGIESGDDFTITSDCPASLAAGAACTVSGNFKSYVSGRHVHSMLLRAAPGGPPTQVVWYVDVLRRPDAMPALELSNALLDFALEGAAASAPQHTTLTNSGTAPAVLAGIASNADFDVTSNCPATLAEGAHCVVTAQVRLTASPGAKYTMNIRAQDAGSAALLMVGPPGGLNPDGSAKPETPGLTFDSATLSFGTVPVGTSASLSTTVTNMGEAAASLESWSVANGGVYVPSHACGKSLASGSSCRLSVTFTPSKAAAFPDLMQFGKNALRLSGEGSQAKLTVGPTALEFGLLAQGSSARKVLHLANSGNLPLSGIHLSRPAAPFVLESTTCTDSLSPRQGCTATFAVTAAGAGMLTSSVQVTATGNSATTVPLSAQVVQVRVSPSTLTFGDTVVGTSAAVQTVTLTNDSAQSVALQLGMVSGNRSFNQSNNCGSSLAGGASCLMSVQFTPVTAGATSGEIGVATGTSALATVSLSGSGTAGSGLRLSSYALNFDDTKVGSTSSAQSVTVHNDSASAAAVTGLGLVDNPSDFAQSNNCGTTLEPAASCRVTVQLTPSSTGARQGTLGLDTSQGRYAVSLAGTGTIPVAELPGLGTPVADSDGYLHYAIKFLDTEYGQSSAVRNVVFRNIGTGPLSVQGISLVSGSADFSQANNCGGTLAAGSSCTIAILFTPSGSGDFVGGIALHSETGKYFFDLTGKGAAAIGVWSKSTSPDFGMVTANAKAQRQFTLTNKGGATARNLVTEVAGDNLMLTTTTCGTSAAPATLAPGVSCKATVVYSPTAPGAMTDAILRTTGTLKEPAVLALQGASPRAGLTFDTAAADYGSLSVEAPVTKTFTLRNTGQVADTIATLTTTGDAFTRTSGTCTVGRTMAATSTCSVIVTAAIPEAGETLGTLSATTSSGAGASVDLAANGIQSVYAVSGSPTALTTPSTDWGPVSVQATTAGLKSFFLTDTAAAALVRANSVTLTGDEGFKLTLLGAVNRTESTGVVCPVTATGSSSACQTTAGYPMVRARVTFMPTKLGLNSATLRIKHNGFGDDFVLNLTGTGMYNPAAELSGSPSSTTAISGDMGTVSFGSPDDSVGTTVTRVVYVRNVGDFGKLAVTPSFEGDSDFKLTQTYATMPSGAINTSCGGVVNSDGSAATECLAQDPSYASYTHVRLNVSFSPKAAGLRKATLKLAHNGSNSPNPIILEFSGVGLYDSMATLSGSASTTTAIDGNLGSKAVAGTVTKLFYVRNTGNYGKLGVAASLSGSADFTIAGMASTTSSGSSASGCGSVIDGSKQSATQCLATERSANGYTTVRIQVAFKPSSTGVQTSTLTLDHTGLNGPEPLVVPLTGTGL